MSTEAGSSRSPAGSEDSSSISSTVIEMLDLLDKMDNLLINSAREARTSLGNPDTFPVTDDHISLLANAKRRYRNANYSIKEVRIYLCSLPDLEVTWETVCRGILRYFRHHPSGEWRLWLRQVERAGSLAWQKALNATNPISNTYQEDRLAMIKALIQKFAIVDEVVDEIHRELHGSEREVRFSAELDDSITASIAIAQRGGVLTAETLLQFKAAIRMQKAAAEAQWTSSSREPSAGDPSRLRRRHTALGRQPMEESQNRVEDQADASSRSSETDVSSQYDPTVLTLVVMLSIAAGTLTGFAWTRADQTVGSLNDADFWLLLQSSILQLAGMIPVMFSLVLSKGASLQPRLWSWFFLGSGAFCSCILPVLYLKVPKEFSGVVAYVGGVAQAFIVLEAMFLADRAVERNKTRDKAG